MRVVLMLAISTVLAGGSATPTAGSRAAEIRGRVIKAHDGTPLRFASVTLRAANGTIVQTAATDDRGDFTLGAVVPGRYAVRASAPGYVSGYWRQSGTRRPAVFFSVTDEDAPRGLIIPLARGGVITGKVVDVRGQPLEGIAVHALVSEERSGREVLRSVGRARISDDRGEFRLFGLEPGEYYVAAGSSHVLTYYANAMTPQEARTVTVVADRESTIGDIVVRPIKTATISGTVIDARGLPARDIELVLAPSSGPISTLLPTTLSGGDGRFSFSGLPPGAYVLQNLPAPARPEFGAARVTLAPGHQSVVLRLTQPRHRRAAIVLEDGAPDIDLRHLSVLLQAVDRNESPLARGARGRARDDWTLELTNIWGPHLLDMTTPPGGWMLKRIDVDGDDFLGTPIDFSKARAITVTLTRRSAAISGIVVDADNRPVPDAEVVIYSADSARWFRDVRRLRLARADADGRFRADGLPSDAYLIAVSDEIGFSDGRPRPAALEALRPVAVPLSVTEGQEYKVTLRIR